MTVLRDLRMPLGLTALVAGLLCASTAIGQPAPAAPVTASEDRDAAIFGQSKPAADDLGDPRMAGAVSERRDLLDDNRLQLGGLLYMRNGLFISDTPGENDRWSRQTLNSSNLMDLYLDARPNDRVRAFIRGRMLYTPVRDDSQASAFLGLGDTSEPVQMQLDQLWLKFDVARRIYLTAGAQHVRWGATRLWNPVDAIYPSRRNPLTLFDQRTGLPMLKLHVPFEVAGNNWSGYLIALADEAVDLAHMGLAGRLEAVVSTAEVGLTASKRIDDDWRLGLDLSAGVWEFDLTGELGVRVDGDGDVRWQVSGGVSWTVAINDEDSLIVGAEYFYNPNGYADGDAAAAGMAAISVDQFLYGPRSRHAGRNPFDFFYMGQQYAALFAVAMGPGDWNDTNFTLSMVGNLSDHSGLGRLDVSTLVLTDLRLELYGSVHLGQGEFGFYAEKLPGAFGDASLAALKTLRPEDLTEEAKALSSGAALPTAELDPLAAPVAQVGVNLRLAL